MTAIICSIIEAAGVILAAIISVGYLGKIVKKTTETYFFNYSGKGHDLNKLMRRAQESIIIVANCGDTLLQNYSERLSRYMRSGVRVKFLLLDVPNYAKMDLYVKGKPAADYTAWQASVQMLRKLKEQYPAQLSVRVFSAFFSVSYIGIDIEKGLSSKEWLPSSVIQMMPYQYHTSPSQSPVTYLTPSSQEQFETTVESIMEMWSDGKEADLDTCQDSIPEHS